jgi:hypothetical protein
VRRMWRTGLALMGAVAAVGGAVTVSWAVYSSGRPEATATVTAAYLAAVAVALTILMPLGSWWWKGRGTGAAQSSTLQQVAAAADWLASATADWWRLEAAKRRIVTPAPAMVWWRWATAEVAVRREDVTGLPVPGVGPSALPDFERPGELLSSGTVIRLHDEVYARLPHGRLVLIGEPGAGKTGAMILLLLSALHRRVHLASEQRDQIPVPVWLTLGDWNPAATPLREWAESTLARDYPALSAPDYGPDVYSGLLRAGRVALFLDGLDEMPERMRPLALQRIGDEAPWLRMVVTSRPEEYLGVVRSGRPGDIAVIELRPVRPKWAAEYLVNGQDGLSRQRWEQVGAYLNRNPDSAAAKALNNPLTLSLARDAYISEDPSELIDPAKFPTAEIIRAHLLDQFLVTAYPDEQQRALAVRQLAWIAYRMGDGRDLRWWEIPAWIPRWKLRLARAAGAGTAAGLAGVAAAAFIFANLPAPGTSHQGAGDVIESLIYGAALAAGLARLPTRPAQVSQAHVSRWKSLLALLEKPWGVLARGFYVLVMALIVMDAVAALLDDSLNLAPGISARTRVATSIALGLIQAGIFILFVFGLRRLFGSKTRFAAPQMLVPRWPRGREVGWIIATGLVFFPLLVPVLLSMWAIAAADLPSSTPAGTYRIERRASLIYGLVYAIAGGLLAGLWAGLVTGPLSTTADRPFSGPTAGFPAGIAFGLAVGGAGWLIVWILSGQISLLKLTELILSLQYRNRIRFMNLLEDASDRQVLRQAGVVYQFRHSELQARLAAMHR